MLGADADASCGLPDSRGMVDRAAFDAASTNFPVTGAYDDHQVGFLPVQDGFRRPHSVSALSTFSRAV